MKLSKNCTQYKKKTNFIHKKNINPLKLWAETNIFDPIPELDFLNRKKSELDIDPNQLSFFSSKSGQVRDQSPWGQVHLSCLFVNMMQI